MATDNGDDDVLGEGKISEDLGYEGRGANDIEGGNTEEAGGYIYISELWNIFRNTVPYRLGSNTPNFLKTSATMGTVEFTGLEMTRTKALGAVVAIPAARSLTIPALI